MLTDTRTYPCPACSQIINDSAKKCRYCSTPVDREAALAAADIQDRVNQACSDASYLRTSAVTMFVRYLFLLGLLMTTLSATLHAQQTQSVRCPLFRINGPLSDLRPPQIYTIESTEELTSPELTFKWEASAGTILSGQGTKVITFDPDNTQNSTITLTIGGLPPACQNMVSISSIVCLGPPDARKFDELTSTDGVRYKAQLDAFAKALRNDPSAYAVVLVYYGGKQHAHDLSKEAVNAKEYLVKQCGLDQKRIEIVQRETRDKEAIELWLGAAGSALPDPDASRRK